MCAEGENPASQERCLAGEYLLPTLLAREKCLLCCLLLPPLSYLWYKTCLLPLSQVLIVSRDRTSSLKLICALQGQGQPGRTELEAAGEGGCIPGTAGRTEEAKVRCMAEGIRSGCSLHCMRNGPRQLDAFWVCMLGQLFRTCIATVAILLGSSAVDGPCACRTWPRGEAR